MPSSGNHLVDSKRFESIGSGISKPPQHFTNEKFSWQKISAEALQKEFYSDRRHAGDRFAQRARTRYASLFAGTRPALG